MNATYADAGSSHHGPAFPDRASCMNESSLLSSLQSFVTFGPSVVQRVAGVGYDRALEILEDLQSRGLVRPTVEPFKWELSEPHP